MQVTLRKQNPFITGYIPARASVLTVNDVFNYRIGVAGIFQSIIFRSNNRLPELINSFLLRALILWKSAGQFRNESLNQDYTGDDN